MVDATLPYFHACRFRAFGIQHVQFVELWPAIGDDVGRADVHNLMDRRRYHGGLG